MVEARIEQPEITAIRLEKKILAALGRQWTPGGISVESLVDEICAEIERLRSQRPHIKFAGSYYVDANGNKVDHR
jgi:hypothetical protein